MVATILALLASGMVYEEVLEDYPSLMMEDIYACLLLISLAEAEAPKNGSLRKVNRFFCENRLNCKICYLCGSYDIL